MLTGLIKVRKSGSRRPQPALILPVMPSLAAAASRIDAVDGPTAPDAAMVD